MIIKLPLYLILIIGLASCTSGDSQDKLIQRINENQAKIEQDADNDTIVIAHVIEAAKAYQDYIDRFPEDSMKMPLFYEKATVLYTISKQYGKAVGLIDSFLLKFPDQERAPYLLYHKAFYIYEEGLNDLNNARSAYEAFINAYPDHSLVEAALFSLQHLGKSNEEILEEIRQDDPEG